MIIMSEGFENIEYSLKKKTYWDENKKKYPAKLIQNGHNFEIVLTRKFDMGPDRTKRSLVELVLSLFNKPVDLWYFSTKHS